MTPPAQDSQVIDRVFDGVGRIKRRLRVTPKLKGHVNAMLTTLAADGRIDLLRGVRDGLSLVVLYHHYRQKSLDRVPVGRTALPLGPAFRAWYDGLEEDVDYSGDSLRTMATTAKRLAAEKGKTVADLPAVLERWREGWGRTAARSFNLTRAHCLAFVRATCKAHHPLYREVAAVEKRKVTPTRKGRPLTVRAFAQCFPRAAEGDVVGDMAWTQATTGMHEKEYWGRWEALADRVCIHGTKAKGRERFVPRVYAPRHPTTHPRTFANAFRARCPGHQPYDLRRTFAHWMEEAGIPRTRRRLYMGHGAQDVTDLYEQHEVAAFLVRDAERIRAYLSRELEES